MLTTVRSVSLAMVLVASFGARTASAETYGDPIRANAYTQGEQGSAGFAVGANGEAVSLWRTARKTSLVSCVVSLPMGDRCRTPRCSSGMVSSMWQ
jgi:hypothetical protein